LLAADRRTDSASVDPFGGHDSDDRCRFQHSFNREPMPCPAFQSLAFVAATSYGTPLRTHVACAHLQVGEAARNQFYPRCALGNERDRERWVAGVGPGEVEVIRALMDEFESIAAPYRPRLVAAKATVIAEARRRTGQSRDALASLVTAFLSDVNAFIALRADAIAETGISPASLSATIARTLDTWQANRRLDLPGIEEHWIGRAEQEVALDSAEIIAVPGLSIGTSTQPSEVRLTGQIDGGNLMAVTAALDAAALAGAPVRVDLSGVTFCSLGGLRHLAIGAGSGDLRLVRVPAHFRRALAAAGLPWEGGAS
jgi:anti-anti-sigma regulatory factor